LLRTASSCFSARSHYRVGGGIRDSLPFTLHETSPGLEVIVVDPRSRGVHAFGDVLIGIGSAMTFIGAFSAIVIGVDLVVVNNASYIHPKHVKKTPDDANRAQTMLFDLSRRREHSWMPPSAGGGLPIFSYRF
jgi:hypothetical protein